MPLYNLFSASEVKLYAVVQPFFCVRGEIVCRCTKKKKNEKQKQQLVNEHDVFIVML